MEIIDNFIKNKLTQKEMNETEINDQIINNFNVNQNSVSDLMSPDFNQKSIEEKLKRMSELEIVLKRISNKELENVYKINYMSVKKYYDIESDEELIETNCTENEKCCKYENVVKQQKSHLNFAKNSSKRKISKKEKSNKKLKSSEVRYESNIVNNTKKSNKTIVNKEKVNKVVINDRNPNKSVNNSLVNAKILKTPNNLVNKWKRPKSCVINDIEDNEMIDFMGSRYLKRDLIRTCDKCENDCEIDELSLAFYLLMNSTEDELPNDLKDGYELSSDESEDLVEEKLSINPINNNENFNNNNNVFDMFNIDVNDIYQQTIIEDNISQSFDQNESLVEGFKEFLEITTRQQTSIGLNSLLIPSTSHTITKP